MRILSNKQLSDIKYKEWLRGMGLGYQSGVSKGITIARGGRGILFEEIGNYNRVFIPLKVIGESFESIKRRLKKHKKYKTGKWLFLNPRNGEKIKDKDQFWESTGILVGKKILPYLRENWEEGRRSDKYLGDEQ